MKVKGEKKVYWVISVWKESGNIYTYMQHIYHYRQICICVILAYKHTYVKIGSHDYGA